MHCNAAEVLEPSTKELPRLRAGVDPRGDYERELSRLIEERRRSILERLDSGPPALFPAQMDD